jgi:hypothetical protein
MKAIRLGVAVVLAPLAALAQPTPTVNYTSFNATPGTQIRLGYYGSAHKNCMPAQIPQIHVLEPPKSGLLTIRRGDLTTEQIATCPHMKIPAMAVFYRVRDAAIGRDHVIYRVDSENGETSVYDVTISIQPAVKDPLIPEVKL